MCKSEKLEIDGFRRNPVNRYYLCKRELFQKIQVIAKENNIKNIVEGSNTDDNGAIVSYSTLSEIKKFMKNI